MAFTAYACTMPLSTSCQDAAGRRWGLLQFGHGVCATVFASWALFYFDLLRVLHVMHDGDLAVQVCLTNHF